MAEPASGDKIEVKTLKNTNLKPADLSKAIEDSTKSMGNKARTAKAETLAKVTKPATTKAAKVQPKAEDSGGSQIIVKNRSVYVGPHAATPEAKPVESIAQETKVELKPPSAMGKPVVTPSSPPTTSYAEAPKPSDSASSAPPPPTDKPNQPLAPAKTPTTAPQQALKVFDTNEYHLPIKPTAGKHYMNGLLSWTILILVFVAVGGYVMIQLEVIDPSDFGL